MPTPVGSCPACGRPTAKKDRLCTGCGHNLRSGEQTTTKVRQARAGNSPLEWIWDNLLGMFGSTLLTISIALVAFLIARGDRDLVGLYTLAVLIAAVITLLLIAAAIAREEGIEGIFTLFYRGWFWWSDSTDGRLKGVLTGLIVAGFLVLPLRASITKSRPSAAAAATTGRP